MLRLAELVKHASFGTVGLVAMAFVLQPSSLTPRATHQAPANGDVARGKYLVEEVAKCTECHTPRDAEGNLNQHAWMQGAPIWIMPVRHIKNWADNVPPLAGLGGFTEAQVATVLEKGTGPEGEVLRPPMHIYHMTHMDSQAIIAYLKTLAPNH